MTPKTDIQGNQRTYLQWISAAAKAGVGSIDPAAIKAAIHDALEALPAESRSSADHVTDAVIKALTDHPLVPSDVDKA
jgi:hypothetical protein